jgi:hypothetical protein
MVRAAGAGPDGRWGQIDASPWIVRLLSRLGSCSVGLLAHTIIQWTAIPSGEVLHGAVLWPPSDVHRRD